MSDGRKAARIRERSVGALGNQAGGRLPPTPLSLIRVDAGAWLAVTTRVYDGFRLAPSFSPLYTSSTPSTFDTRVQIVNGRHEAESAHAPNLYRRRREGATYSESPESIGTRAGPHSQASGTGNLTKATTCDALQDVQRTHRGRAGCGNGVIGGGGDSGVEGSGREDALGCGQDAIYLLSRLAARSQCPSLRYAFVPADGHIQLENTLDQPIQAYSARKDAIQVAEANDAEAAEGDAGAGISVLAIAVQSASGETSAVSTSVPTLTAAVPASSTTADAPATARSARSYSLAPRSRLIGRFTAFLLPPDNAPLKNQTHDKTRSLSMYYVSSIHNASIVGNYLTGESAGEGYVRAWLHSCQNVKLDSPQCTTAIPSRAVYRYATSATQSSSLPSSSRPIPTADTEEAASSFLVDFRLWWKRDAPEGTDEPRARRSARAHHRR
ncbi:hypothetical protein PENSPDRAFT_671266 [Peniophora sp. CONT]|nr:hypothetical protein PENSPDRAFT_671266 [Peniophora sp. CONT]